MLTALLFTFLLHGAARAEDDDFDEVTVESTIPYLITELPRVYEHQDVVRHIFELIDERIELDGAPAGHVRGRVILGFEGPGAAGVDRAFVAKETRRVLEHGEVFDEVHYTIAPGAWVGLLFHGIEDFNRKVDEAKAEFFGEGVALDESLPEEAIQDLCDIVLRAPVRH